MLRRLFVRPRGLSVHLRGLVEVTGDLAVLARQVDPHTLSGILRKVELPVLNRKARALKAALGEIMMLVARAESAKLLIQAEHSGSLMYQSAIFCNVFESEI